ncbi:MAG: hypothetical protein GF411_17755 [Candidatus Lokiarchaeota archaeon]|nr:hypothetical protein [Candidatus Lokiarchaeota archaeon]
MSSSIEIDLSFAELVIESLSSSMAIESIIAHPAARLTYSHAKRFGNTDSDIRKFWTDILNRHIDDETVVHAIRECVNYIETRKDAFQSMFKSLMHYLPSMNSSTFHLYANFGYDIGIVSEDSALINLGHSFFQQDHRELLFMSMHELHHVGFTLHNPIFSIHDLKRISDLIAVIQYATHLEGLAVYAPLELRLEQKGMEHEDYQALFDSKTRLKRISEFFEIYEKLANTQNRELEEEDFEILEVMSGRDKRLWYITGAHMAERIDKELGRATLVQTIVDGPSSFFEAYNTLS